MASAAGGQEMKRNQLIREVSVADVKAKGPSEAHFLKQVIAFAKLHGWLVAHFRPALTQKGRWLTAVQGDGKGFPDLILLRRGLMVVAELKRNEGAKPTEEQEVWLKDFMAMPPEFVHVAIWRPCDWAEIEKVLGGER